MILADKERQSRLGQLRSSLGEDDTRLQVALLLLMVTLYGLLLSAGAETSPLNLTFNSMLAHLLHGQFYVDPGTIGGEGFLRQGHVYAYWGAFCALLRLPLFLVGRRDVDMTVVSCTLGVCLAGAAKVRTVLFLRRQSESPVARSAAVLMLVYVVFGGGEIAYLRSSIFQEVVFWAAAFGAVFVYFAVKGLVEGRFSRRTLSAMAASAGLALLTRVSTGIGLIAAFSFVLVWLAIRAQRRNGWRSLWTMVTVRRAFLPVVILALLMAMAGAVNYFRWGNPLTFADHRLYLLNLRYPDRMPRTKLYGYFNLRRIPFGLSYYFAPVWAFHGTDGRLLLEAMQTRLLDAVELPPGSFFLTDMLAFAWMALLGVQVRLRRSIRVDRGALLALCAGLFLPCGLMLTAISMNYRYRMEFYPLIDLLSFVGLYQVMRDENMRVRFARWRRWFVAAVVMSVTWSLIEMILYKLSDWGPSQVYLHHGLVRYYLSVLTGANGS